MLKDKNWLFSVAVITVVQITFTSMGLGYSTDDLIGKAANATTSLARGDVNGAASQMIGGYAIPVTQASHIYASPYGVNFQQAVRPLSVSNPYLGVGTTYNAYVNPIHPANIAQNVQVNSGNSYFSNNTTVPIPTRFKRE